MKSKMLGKNTEAVEITHISSNGIWLLSNDKEYFMSYKDFPWFKDVPIKKILNVEEPHLGHFYWADLDVDLSVDIIEHPDRFPIKMKLKIK